MMYRIDTKDFADKVRHEYLAFVCEGKYDSLQGLHDRVILLETLAKAPHSLISNYGYVKVFGTFMEITFHNKVDYVSLGDEMQWWRSTNFFAQIDERNNWYRIYRAKELLAVEIYEDSIKHAIWQ